MQRLIIGLVTVIVLGACGSDDGEGAEATDATPVETTSSAQDEEPVTADEPAAEPSDEPTAEEQSDEPAEEEPNDVVTPTTEGEPSDDDGDGDASDGEDDGDRTEVASIYDLPSECVDLFRDFLQDIEPTVSGIDWETATLSDFEQIGPEFETISESFDADSRQEGCNEFDPIDDDTAIDGMIDFAKNEAPGTVGFLEFVRTIQDVTSSGSDSDGDSASLTCDDAIAAIEALMNDYGSMTAVPASELVQLGTVTTELTNLCPPEQLAEFFQREDIAEFLAS